MQCDYQSRIEAVARPYCTEHIDCRHREPEVPAGMINIDIFAAFGIHEQFASVFTNNFKGFGGGLYAEHRFEVLIRASHKIRHSDILKDQSLHFPDLFAMRLSDVGVVEDQRIAGGLFEESEQLRAHFRHQ